MEKAKVLVDEVRGFLNSDKEVEKQLDIFSEKAWDRWGSESQIMMAIEECNEAITELGRLNVSLCKLLNGRGGTRDDILTDLAGELADVHITNRQIILKVVGQELFDKTLQAKLSKAQKYLEEK